MERVRLMFHYKALLEKHLSSAALVGEMPVTSSSTRGRSAGHKAVTSSVGSLSPGVHPNGVKFVWTARRSDQDSNRHYHLNDD